MITAIETRALMKRDLKWWRIPLMDFVDDFRYYKDSGAIQDPFVDDDEKMNALFASVIETLCDELGFAIPAWLEEIPACREPYFVSGLENLKAITIVESPVRFRRRKIFVLENFLHRV